MKFSDTTLRNAIVSTNNEFAWKRDFVFHAIDELENNNIAILGGDVWAILKDDFKTPKIGRINHEDIIVGIIKDKSGTDTIFNWHSDKLTTESWSEYVVRTKKETIEAINKMNAENSVAEEFKFSIYYNLVFANQSEFTELKYH